MLELPTLNSFEVSLIIYATTYLGSLMGEGRGAQRDRKTHSQLKNWLLKNYFCNSFSLHCIFFSVLSFIFIRMPGMHKLQYLMCFCKQTVCFQYSPCNGQDAFMS